MKTKLEKHEICEEAVNRAYWDLRKAINLLDNRDLRDTVSMDEIAHLRDMANYLDELADKVSDMKIELMD